MVRYLMILRVVPTPNNSNNRPALVDSSKYSINGNTNNETDDKGDDDEEDDKDDDTTDDANQRHPRNTDSQFKGTKDNDNDADADAGAGAGADNNTDTTTMGNSNLVTQTTQDFEVGDGGARDDDDADVNADDVDDGTAVQQAVSFPKAPKAFIPLAAKSALGEPPNCNPNKFVLPYTGMGKLWKRPPHRTVDNFFNGDSILDWMGKRGLGIIGTVARNKLPKGVPYKYFHKENASHSAKKFARVARMCNPVTLVKEVPAKAESGKFTKAYHRVHCSFQSTGSCNLGSVNSLSTNSFFLHRKGRGRGSDKRCCAIEMNHARELYLRPYGKLDQIDSSISRANIGYKSWKYYHSAVNHAKALSIATAYDVYKELTDGKSLQNRCFTITPKTSYTQLTFCFVRILRCQSTNTRELKGGDFTATPLIMGAGRFCFSSIDMGRHLASFKSAKWHSVILCFACGKACYCMCSKCKDGEFDVALCSVEDGNRCFQQYHHHRFFGLLKCDMKHRTDSNIRSKGNWNPWNVRECLLNEEYMEYLVFGKKKKKKRGEVKGAKERSSISVTELTADLISVVTAL
eukprot:jgi/Psemu1/19289/gm1.19289_g